MDLTNEDVADILALLDSLPYDELDLETPRFRLTLRRTPDGWTQSTQVLSAPDPLAPASPGSPPAEATGSMSHRAGYNRHDVTSRRPDGGADGEGGEGAELVGVGGAVAVDLFRGGGAVGGVC